LPEPNTRFRDTVCRFLAIFQKNCRSEAPSPGLTYLLAYIRPASSDLPTQQKKPQKSLLFFGSASFGPGFGCSRSLYTFPSTSRNQYYPALRFLPPMANAQFQISYVRHYSRPYRFHKEETQLISFIAVVEFFCQVWPGLPSVYWPLFLASTSPLNPCPRLVPRSKSTL